MTRTRIGFSTLGSTLGLAVGVTLGGCNAFDAPVGEGSVRIVPIDNRPAQQALVEPAPIIGGTLAVSPDGRLAVAADPDRNAVSIVDLASFFQRTRVELLPGDEPGRVVIDGPRHLAHVALRRAGAIATIDLGNGQVLSRTAVCPAPRGTALDAPSDTLYVACADGQLVALSGEDRAERWRARLPVDLRDVVISGDELVLTRFKTAEAIRVTKQGLMVSTSQAGGVQHQRAGAIHDFDAAVAWRAVAAPNGEVVMLHQRAQSDTVGPAPNLDPATPPSPVYYGGDTPSFNCNSIVHGAISAFDQSGQRVATSGPLADAVLPVDVAVSNDSIVIAVAGSGDPAAPRPFMADARSGQTTPSATPTFTEMIHVSRASLSVEGEPTTVSCGSAQQIFGNEQVTAVAFMPNGNLVYQTREPAALKVRTVTAGVFGSQRTFGEPLSVALGGDSVADTGHDLFHRDSGAGIACASCHMEGGDDGRVWKFNAVGDRRTQAVHVGLEDTAPFHWDGDVESLHALMSQVFVGRMGGVHQSEERLDTLSHWMFAVQAPAPIRAANDAAALRGEALFHSREVGCGNCHNGPKLTNNGTVDVGTGELGQGFQVPSLVAIGYRAPFIHTGCAETLRARFDNPECGGGDAHGKTSQLDDEQLDDLVAYLETL